MVVGGWGVVWLEILVIRLSVFFRLFTYFRFAVGNSQLAQLKSRKTVGRLLASYLHTLTTPLPRQSTALLHASPPSLLALIYASLSHANCSFGAQVCLLIFF